MGCHEAEKIIAMSSADSTDGPRILVVEDHPGIAQGLRALLGSRGYLVELASCVETALRELDSTTYHLVVADFDLGSEDGLSVVRALRVRHPSIPVLAVTAVDRAEASEAAAELELADCLEKPVDPERLVAAVARHIEF